MARVTYTDALGLGPLSLPHFGRYVNPGDTFEVPDDRLDGFLRRPDFELAPPAVPKKKDVKTTPEVEASE